MPMTHVEALRGAGAAGGARGAFSGRGSAGEMTVALVQFREPVTFNVVECCSCGVAFGLTATLERERRRDHASFYCPNGHSQGYMAKSDVQLANEERDAAKKNEAFWRERAKAEETARNAAVKLAEEHAETAQRLAHRAGNGVCPCCKRTFKALARHMATKHPEMVGDADRAKSVAAERPIA